jgi:predicted signal transduction protein with EAL and GGDEF domain
VQLGRLDADAAIRHLHFQQCPVDRDGQRVIAEGVEDKEQLAFLKAHECNEAQGFLFSRPVDAALMQAMFGTGIVA